MPHSARVLAAAGELGVPRIHFGVGTTNLLGLMGEAGADVVGVDWRTPLAQAIPLVGDRAVQGNLDPTLVFAPTDVMTARAAEIIEAGRAAQGPHLQPRPRRDPVDRPRPAQAADGVRAVLPALIAVTERRHRRGRRQLRATPVGPGLPHERGLQVAHRLRHVVCPPVQHQQRHLGAVADQ